MSISGVSAAASAVSADQPQSVAVARKILDQTREQGQQMVQLVQSAAPPGTGKIINLTG
ncbi:MAG: putative motility protein [Deltaproteobacteria bacterium]|nr:putative motility protein [Deltaproteobacteria bacterium]